MARPAAAFTAALAAALLGHLSSTAQPAPYAGQERVTGVDLMVRSGGDRPLRPRQVRARVDGAPRPVVAVEGPGRDEAWQVVVYVDTVLSDEHQVAWAANVLAQHTASLQRLGPVELVVADPEPRTVVAAPAGAEAFQDALASLVYLGETDDALVEGRIEILDALAEPVGDEEGEDAADPAALAAAIGADETARVRERLETLLLALVERARAAPAGAGGRRLVVLVSGGFDLRTDWLPAGLRPTISPLEDEVPALARALTAYGWVPLPLLAPPEAGPVPGLRIGRWRVGPPPGIPPPEAREGEDRGLESLPALGAYHEEDRDPEKAEAHLALAEAHQRAGEAQPAVDEATLALHHFADDPRTAPRQARTLLLMADAYRALGEADKARRALRQAARRDPAAVEGHPALRALPGSDGLRRLAEAAGGELVRSGTGLGAALAGLDRWALVTVQLGGLPDGRLHAAEVSPRGRRPRLETPGWLRFGTPEPVASARIRRLAGGPPEGDLEVTAVLGPGGELRVHLAGLPGPPADTPQRTPSLVLRATAALAGEGGPEVLSLGRQSASPAADGSLELVFAAPPEAAAEGTTVLIEELLSESWGTAPVRRADRSPSPAS